MRARRIAPAFCLVHCKFRKLIIPPLTCSISLTFIQEKRGEIPFRIRVMIKIARTGMGCKGRKYAQPLQIVIQLTVYTGDFPQSLGA